MLVRTVAKSMDIVSGMLIFDQGRDCSEDRVARLVCSAGIAAQIGCKRRSDGYRGRQAVVVDKKAHENPRSISVFLRRMVMGCLCVGSLFVMTTTVLAEETNGSTRLDWLRLPNFENIPSKHPRTVEYYAQLNPGSFYVDNGGKAATNIEDNDASPSRIGMTISWEYPDTGTLVFNAETGLGVSGSSDSSVSGESSSIEIGKNTIRHFELIYTSPQIGRFYAGQGNMASDGVAYSDLSGTTIASYAGITDFAGDAGFTTSDGSDAGFTVSDVFATYDGPRRFRLRYDTPNYNGFTLSLATGKNLLNSNDSNKYHDVGLRYDKDYGNVLLNSSIGFTLFNNTDSLLTGSMSALHKSSGVSFTVAAGTPETSNARYIFSKLGYQGDWLKFGKTALSIDIYRGENFRNDGAHSLTYALGAVQRLKRFERFSVDLYASYRLYDYDTSGADLNTISVTLVGVRFKF